MNNPRSSNINHVLANQNGQRYGSKVPRPITTCYFGRPALRNRLCACTPSRASTTVHCFSETARVRTIVCRDARTKEQQLHTQAQSVTHARIAGLATRRVDHLSALAPQGIDNPGAPARWRGRADWTGSRDDAGRDQCVVRKLRRSDRAPL